MEDEERVYVSCWPRVSGIFLAGMLYGILTAVVMSFAVFEEWTMLRVWVVGIVFVIGVFLITYFIEGVLRELDQNEDYDGWGWHTRRERKSW